MSPLTSGYLRYLPIYLNHTNSIVLEYRQLNLTEYLLFLCFDDDSYTECNQMGLKCWKDVNVGKVLTGPVGSFQGLEATFGSPAFNRLMWRRNDVVLWIVKQKFNIVFSDIDVIWLKDPFPAFDDSDLQAGQDGNRMNAGFWFFRNNPNSRLFFHNWVLKFPCRWQYEDQDVLDNIMRNRHDLAQNVTLRIVSPELFRHGCSDPPGSEARTFIYHPTCRVGLNAKIEAVKEFLQRYRAAVEQKQ